MTLPGLLFTAEMYGVQLDLLATRLGISAPAARATVARWRQQGYADSAQLGPGGRWVWLTQPGLAAERMGVIRPRSVPSGLV